MTGIATNKVIVADTTLSSRARTAFTTADPFAPYLERTHRAHK